MTKEATECERIREKSYKVERTIKERKLRRQKTTFDIAVKF